MKRDPKLIEQLLIRIQKFPPSIDNNYNYEIVCKGYDNQTINYHLYLMKKDGLIDGNIFRSIINKKITVNYNSLELTPKGHDFIDPQKNNKVWRNG